MYSTCDVCSIRYLVGNARYLVGNAWYLVGNAWYLVGNARVFGVMWSPERKVLMVFGWIYGLYF